MIVITVLIFLLSLIVNIINSTGSKLFGKFKFCFILKRVPILNKISRSRYFPTNLGSGLQCVSYKSGLYIMDHIYVGLDLYLAGRKKTLPGKYQQMQHTDSTLVHFDLGRMACLWHNKHFS